LLFSYDMARRRMVEDIFESSDEEDNIRRPRWIRERADHFRDLDNKDFVTRFRLSKLSALYVLEQIENQLEFPSDR